jgi:sec-independent protein translocase protein TatC
MKGDDLFEKSSMTFGEHLEELRIALVKSSFWLAGGMLIGLLLATKVVAYMQGPLEISLQNFYKKQSIREMNEANKASGAEVSSELETWMKEKKVVSQTVWVDPKRLDLRDSQPEKLDDPSFLANADSEGLPDPAKMLKLRMFVGVNASTEALGLQEPFMIWLKAAFVVAFIVASPGIYGSSCRLDSIPTNVATSTSSFRQACCCSGQVQAWRFSSSFRWSSTSCLSSTQAWALGHHRD